MDQNESNWIITDQNGSERIKIFQKVLKWIKTDHNGLKRIKMDQNGSKWIK